MTAEELVNKLCNYPEYDVYCWASIYSHEISCVDVDEEEERIYIS